MVGAGSMFAELLERWFLGKEKSGLSDHMGSSPTIPAYHLCDPGKLTKLPLAHFRLCETQVMLFVTSTYYKY